MVNRPLDAGIEEVSVVVYARFPFESRRNCGFHPIQSIPAIGSMEWIPHHREVGAAYVFAAATIHPVPLCPKGCPLPRSKAATHPAESCAPCRHFRTM